MPGGRMVKYHIQHDAHAPRFALADQLLQIRHRPEERIDLPVICHIVSVVSLGRGKHRGQPQVIYAQFLKVI